MLTEPEEPAARRYIVNDATYEALGVILADNPIGTLAFRDELVSLLKTLDKEENAAARGFFLSAWNGTGGYSFDRITRGKTYIEAACLSLLGSTQPGRLAEYMSRATAGGAGDDGMIQRFSLLVWPDQSLEWKEADRYPNSVARETAWRVFERLDELTAEAAGAQTDQFETIPFLRFEGGALGIFREWRGNLERQLRSDDLSPALESHLAKYRTLVPAVALINHLADGGVGEISEKPQYCGASPSRNTSKLTPGAPMLPALRWRPSLRRQSSGRSESEISGRIHCSGRVSAGMVEPFGQVTSPGGARPTGRLRLVSADQAGDWWSPERRLFRQSERCEVISYLERLKTKIQGKSLGACLLNPGEMGFEPLKPVGEPDAANSRIRFDVRVEALRPSFVAPFPRWRSSAGCECGKGRGPPLGELQDIVGEADEAPLVGDLLDAAQEKLTEAARLLDLSEHRLGQLLS